VYRFAWSVCNHGPICHKPAACGLSLTQTEKFAAIIRLHRERPGASDKVIAELVGVPQATVVKLRERVARDPQLPPIALSGGLARRTPAQSLAGRLAGCAKTLSRLDDDGREELLEQLAERAARGAGGATRRAARSRF
jgi:hypothetical protein